VTARTCGLRALGLLALAGCLDKPARPDGDDELPAIDASVEGGGARAWVTRETDPAPLHLFGPRMVYDSRDRRVLAYGGSTIGGDPSGATDDFMSWDGTRWVSLCDPCPPGPRLHHGFAYDSARGVAVLYGGVDQTGARQEEVWEWDGRAWSNRGVAGPPARSHVWTSYDAERGRMVVFGGESDLAISSDILEYDGENWYAVNSAEDGPTARRDAGGNAAAYDPVGKQVLVYGDDQLADDLWAWDGTGWRLVCARCTDLPRLGAMLAVDPSRQRILVVGGFQPGVEVTGTWELSLDGVPLCDLREPSARDTSALTHDVDRDVLVLFGGNGTGCEGNCNETLEMIDADGGNCAP
jgi:hypothetical protein